MTRHELNEVFARTSFLQGANATYLAELHARYKDDPASVDADWRAFFASFEDNKESVLAEARGPSWAPEPERALLPARPQSVGGERDALDAARDTLAARMLIRNYRTRGHLAAKLDPLELIERREHPELRPKTYGFTKRDYDRPIYIGGVFGFEFATLRQILEILKKTYCGHIGAEYMHISDPEQRAWIQDRMEGREAGFTDKGKIAILKKLIEAEAFERFLDVKYTGTKRFGLDGGESMVPALEQIIKRGGQLGVGEIVIGMPHRGRLNVLANVMAKPYRAIFNEFRGGSAHPDDVEGSGDVKYHLGASSDREFDLNRVHLSLTANPSHLEIVDPVVLGKVRAKQDQRGDRERKEVLPLHAAWRCGFRRTGRGRGMSRPFRFARTPHRRLAAFHRQQSDRLHHRAALFALLALPLRRRQNDRCADLSRERRRSRGRGLRRQDRDGVPPALRQAGRHRHVLLPAPRP